MTSSYSDGIGNLNRCRTLDPSAWRIDDVSLTSPHDSSKMTLASQLISAEVSSGRQRVTNMRIQLVFEHFSSQSTKMKDIIV